MTYWGQRNSRVTDMLQRFQGPRCTSNYIKTKTEIEQKIDTFNYKDQKNYCKNCNVIKKNITEKTGELQHCYGLRGLHPIENTEKIKEFISNCPDIPNCRYPPNKPVSKPVVTKGPKKGSCTGYENCKEKTVITDEQKSKAAPGINARNPQARRSEVKASLKEDRGHSDGEELRDGKVISRIKPEVNPFGDSVRTQDEGSKLTFNQPSVSAEETVTPMQHASSPSPSANIELGTTSSALSSQRSVTRDSHSSSSTQVEGLNKGVHATNLGVVQIEGVNELKNIPVLAQNNQGLAHDNADAIKTSAERDSDSTSSRDDKADYGESISEDTIDRVSSDQNGHAHVHQGNTDSSGLQKKVAHSEHLARGDENHGIITKESVQHTNGSDVVTTSEEVPGNELTSGKANELGIFKQIFSTIQANKENVIKTSIPMGVVLLISLLLKYTPLWRILTKRKRKKQSHMNEKLQRVLQQPSIASEERSIPFSYSAFEYST
ncbi:hypothetical protein PVBG_05749 [Plasmodium vivax Brazil I]|uniref:Variable surface protein Vir18 n=1 Tax=Plasmodium vivax (strain Brazil I) TaxID=1033975 RepID=A0A0J9VB72_PLAV1|nr:hypothetical protein PVBG_05749 [Plasmodium vivax Brazil I]